jgi:hypothetical protein
VFVVVAISMMFLAGTVFAQDKEATPAQAKELHKKLIAYAKEVGCEKAIAELKNPKTMFKLYSNANPSVSALNGVTLANVKFPYLVDKNFNGLKDADGKYFIRNGLEKRRQGDLSFSTSQYKWKDSKTNNIETRTLLGEGVSCGGTLGVLSFSVTYDGKM